jgi:hypothetical protein
LQVLNICSKPIYQQSGEQNYQKGNLARNVILTRADQNKSKNEPVEPGKKLADSWVARLLNKTVSFRLC